MTILEVLTERRTFECKLPSNATNMKGYKRRARSSVTTKVVDNYRANVEKL